ncbi:hypothetical protein OKA04_09210 [Luteolibacter flavescens]|uniref:Transmembrane protein n=1 Tax=Luteolibacter flavescens TaxID=1859460 RepID=A0ABT3FMV8_9BACT|nr:hypothetical protein [Luteolibacter flavescens]MCW1884904.1 hypothetical protein [Luteolibacter flavescens]
MSENPYAPPSAGAMPTQAEDQRPALREIVVAWEKLRIWYNAILLVPGLAVVAMWTGQYGMPLLFGLVSAVVIAIGANICFLLGPAAELYLRAIFRQGRPLGRGRALLFWAGVVVSLGVFVVATFEVWLL